MNKLEEIKKIRAEAKLKLASLKEKKKNAVELAKNSAKEKVRTQNVKPVKVGHIELSEEASNSFSLIVLRKDKGDFKAGDVIARASVGKYITPEVLAQVKKIKEDVAKQREAVFKEAKEKIYALDKENRVKRLAQKQEKIKKVKAMMERLNKEVENLKG